MFSKFSKQQLQAAVEALKDYKEPHFVRHDWEELVSRLCHDSDPVLREEMTREMEIIMEKDPSFINLGAV